MNEQSERPAPVACLSTKDRLALMECSGTGTLYKHNRVWRGSPDGHEINGNTVANLGRDGLLRVTKAKDGSTATLTKLGEWYVRTLLTTRNEKS
jgi:hypothetical protein